MKHPYIEMYLAHQSGAKIEYYSVHIKKWIYTPMPTWDKNVKFRLAKKQ